MSNKKTPHRCRKCRQIRLLLLVLILAVILYMILVLLPQWMQGGNKDGQYFKVVAAKSYLKDYNYYIDATLQMKFSPAVVEALENGVPLTLRIELQLVELNYWFDKIIKESSLQFELRYHALTDIYSIRDLQSGQAYSFNSRYKAMEQLGDIRGALLIARQKLNIHKRHRLSLRVLLDIWQLPDVLRPVASLSQEWQLQSPWYVWEL